MPPVPFCCSWVTGAGVGAYQLRVGQPPGSTQPLVALEEHVGHSQEEVDVVLVEAKPNDLAVPEGKVLARIGGEQLQASCWVYLEGILEGSTAGAKQPGGGGCGAIGSQAKRPGGAGGQGAGAQRR